MTTRDAGGTKVRILEIAEDVFAERGFSGASTREIAGRANVNISSLHYHWESKETLYRAVFRSIYDRIVELVHSTIPEELAGRPFDRAAIEASMGTMFDFFAEHPNVARLLVRRFLDKEDGLSDVEHDVLVPSWKLFATVIQDHGGEHLRELDVEMFMLTMYAVSLTMVLDSRHTVDLLDGGMDDPAVRDRIRRWVVQLVPNLLRMKPPQAS